jgi:hypothetical protein
MPVVDRLKTPFSAEASKAVGEKVFGSDHR